ncbi:hypothetical protein FBQ85_20145 [Cytophagia bacterium CHB2]|nr:hypothetical protein [Cytophagia bacterium CHB2]
MANFSFAAKAAEHIFCGFSFCVKKRLSASAASTALIAAPLKALPEGMPSSFRSTNAEFNCFVPLGGKFFEDFCAYPAGHVEKFLNIWQSHNILSQHQQTVLK